MAVGETLTATPSNINDGDGNDVTNFDNFEYRWNNGEDIAGTTGGAETYVVQANDAGKTIKVKVTFTRTGNEANNETIESNSLGIPGTN